MTFEKPKIFFNNRLRTAQEGNDGTIYAACAEAIADPDDPNKVRGSIIPAADIPDLTTLEGCGIVFDTTQNEYRIEDYAALGRRLNSLNLWASQMFPCGALIVGAYLYISTNPYPNLPGVVSKISLTTLQVVDQVVFAADEIGAGTIVQYGEFLFVVSADSGKLGKLVQINIASFERIGFISFGAGIYVPSISVGIMAILYGQDIFVACTNSASAGGIAIIVRVNQGTVVLSTLTLAAGDINPAAMVVYGTDIFVACYDTGISRTKIIQIASGLSRTGVLQLNANEDSPTCMIVYGTDIFVACSNNAASYQGVIVRTAGGISRTSALTLSATEVSPSSMILYGTDIFVLCYNSGTVVSQLVCCASGTSRTSALALSGHAGGFLLNIGSDIYAVIRDTLNSIGFISKINAGTSETATLILSGGELKPKKAVIYSNSLFVLCENYYGTGVLVQLNPDTLDRLGVLVLDSTEKYPTDLIVYGSDIFVCCEDGSHLAVLVRTAGGITRISVVAGTAAELYPVALLAYGTDIFMLCRNGSDVAVLVRLPGGLSRASSLTLGAAEKFPKAMITYGTDIFVACEDGSHLAVLVRTSGGLTRTSVLAGTAGELYPVDLLLSGTDIFMLCRNGSNLAVIVRTAGGLSRTSSLTLNAGELYPVMMKLSHSYIFVLCINGSNVAVLVKTLGGTSRISASTFNADELYPSMLVFNSDNILTACKNSLDVGNVQLIDPWDYFTLFESLQDVDIGDSFTVRAGLQGVNEDAARPAMYAADGHRTPRALGLTNTIYKIRAHAPNFIEDGGFESGAFSPNWSAYAGWSINTANKLEGAYSALWDCSANNPMISRAITKNVKKGMTYRCIYKTRALTANPQAAVLTVNPLVVGTLTAIQAAISGNVPTITTTATWQAFDFIPDFSCDNWALYFYPDSTKKGSCTGIVTDEIYIYDKLLVNSLIIGYHNLVGINVNMLVNAWKCSPLRSTATVDANNKTQLSFFTGITSDVVLKVLTASYDPIMEFVIPAVSGFIPALGEIYVGDYWQLPNFIKGNIDPRRTNADNLIDVTYTVENMNPALRLTSIEDLFRKLRDSESFWAQWDTDAPILMESPRDAREAHYNTYMVNLILHMVERL